MLKWTRDNGIIRNSETFIRPSTSKYNYHPQSLKAGFSFNQYDLPIGNATFTVCHFPLFDSIQDSGGSLIPGTEIPTESLRLVIGDVSGGSGEALGRGKNICLVRKNNQSATTIHDGRFGMDGKPSANPKSSKDEATMHISDTIGVQVTDPTATGQLIPSFE